MKTIILILLNLVLINSWCQKIGDNMMLRKISIKDTIGFFYVDKNYQRQNEFKNIYPHKRNNKNYMIYKQNYYVNDKPYGICILMKKYILPNK